MNYYIQGDTANADKIRAAFEKLGIDALDFGFADKTLVYCSIGGCVQTLPYSINLMHILYSHPDYQELELPIESKFKVGDWVVSTREPSLTYRILESNVTNELGELDYKVEIYSNGIYGKTCFIASNKMDEWGRLWTLEDAKDGDILVTTKVRSCPFIYRKTSYNNNLAYYYAGIDGNGNFCEGCLKRTLFHFGSVSDVIPATKEQRDLLFAKMKEAGYQWDADKKELHKIKPHYDIANFHAGMPVLVRETSLNAWQYVLFSHCYIGGDGLTRFNAGLVGFTQCIPFNEETKHLLGTSNPCDEKYINW